MLPHLRKLLLLPVCRAASPVNPAASPIHSFLHRALLSTAAVGASPAHFAAEDFLVTTCGLSKEQAAKAAKGIAHCKSPAKANAVISFLASPALRLSKADIRYLVSRDARVLNCSVDKNLRPRIDAFFRHGFTAAQIRTFIRLAPHVFRGFKVDEKLGFLVPFLGSPDNFLRTLKYNFYLVSFDLDRVVKANIQLLQETGLSDTDIAKICLNNTRLLSCKTETMRAMLTRAKQIGVPRNSPMFKHVVSRACCLGPETMAAKLKFLGELLGCSDAEVAKALRMTPALLSYSQEKLRRTWEFLTKVAGLDSKYILGWATIMTYSLERRIAPRHYVWKVLQEKRLMPKKHSFFQLVRATDELFRRNYIIRHEDVLPGLADAYASACKGSLPT